MKQAETLIAQAATAAVLGSNVEAIEQMEVRGRFNMVCRGARDDVKEEYDLLMARIELMQRRYKASWTAKLGLNRSLRKKIRELEAEAYDMTEVKWERSYDNLVTTIGKNYLLDNGLAGSSFTAAYYLGLISSTSYSAVNAADTMSSHAGWLEAGATNAPTYSGARKTTAWSSASGGSKALSAGLVFTFTGSGTVKGSFMTTNSTVDGTTGTLISAGLFTGGDQPVASGNTVTVSYSLAL